MLLAVVHAIGLVKLMFMVVLVTCRACGAESREQFPYAVITEERLEALKKSLCESTGGFAWCPGCQAARSVMADYTFAFEGATLHGETPDGSGTARPEEPAVAVALADS